MGRARAQGGGRGIGGFFELKEMIGVNGVEEFFFLTGDWVDRIGLDWIFVSWQKGLESQVRV